MLMEIFLSVAFAAAASQKERCAPAEHDRSSDMICVNRNGHCATVTIDGQTTVALTDEAIAARVHAIKHGEDVCWQLAQPVSTKFRANFKAGGLNPKFLGSAEETKVNVYELDDYDPKVDSRLDSLSGVGMQPDGNPNGTWQLHSERPLPTGEYVVVFRLYGTGNWDRQAVLLKLDPKIAPGPADKGTLAGSSEK